jgi:hypothetical protein
MSAASPPDAPVRFERTIPATLATVQFTHILDYMVIMPLGFAVATLACSLRGSPPEPAAGWPARWWWRWSATSSRPSAGAGAWRS